MAGALCGIALVGLVCGQGAGRAAGPARDSLASRQLGARPAAGRFLVAARGLTDPNFARTVVLVLEHDSGGTLGLIVNRPTKRRLDEVLEGVEADEGVGSVYFGGPVALDEMRLLVRSSDPPEPARLVFGEVYVSGDAGLLARLARGDDPRPFRTYAGYAGWARGQLDLEMLRGDWHVLEADAALVFETPSAEVWPELIERAGYRVALQGLPAGGGGLPPAPRPVGRRLTR